MFRLLVTCILLGMKRERESGEREGKGLARYGPVGAPITQSARARQGISSLYSEANLSVAEEALILA